MQREYDFEDSDFENDFEDSDFEDSEYSDSEDLGNLEDLEILRSRMRANEERERREEREREKEWIRLGHIAGVMREICPQLSEIGVVVENKVVRKGKGLDHLFVRSVMVGLIDSDEEAKATIDGRPNSIYQFKKSETSYFELNRDEDQIFSDYDYVNDTYYALVYGKDIQKFTKDSAEMINGEDKIDPMDDGKFHAANVYVASKEVPFGLGELVRRKKASRNMNLYLIVSEEGAKDFIKKFDPIKSLFEMDYWDYIS